MGRGYSTPHAPPQSAVYCLLGRVVFAPLLLSFFPSSAMISVPALKGFFIFLDRVPFFLPHFSTTPCFFLLRLVSSAHRVGFFFILPPVSPVSLPFCALMSSGTVRGLQGPVRTSFRVFLLLGMNFKFLCRKRYAPKSFHKVPLHADLTPICTLWQS